VAAVAALNPLFLLAGLAVGIPLFLHLFQRHQVRRVSFPALRYLQRTERDHARRIRLRQLLLLLLRGLIVLGLVGAGARLFVKGGDAAHPPTALVIILDNSMSSGVVMGERRALDRLKALALRTLEAANPDDRIWVLRSGEPWLSASTGTPDELRAAVNATTASSGGGDLTAALARAEDLLQTAGLERREIHLLSDLQATAFDQSTVQPAGDIPVVVWLPSEPPPDNRAVTGALVGGGLPPLQGQRSEVSVSVSSAPGDTTPVAVRVVVEERVRGAGSIPPGASLSLLLPPTPAGWVLGYAETDADALRADDRRYFAFHARPAPRVAVLGDPGLFVNEALGVLESAGRVRQAQPTEAEAVISGAGVGLDAVRPGAAVLIVPPAEPELLPSLNRRLSGAGIPWRVERQTTSGEGMLSGAELPETLSGVRVFRQYRLSPPASPDSPHRTMARVGEEAWAVTGTDVSGHRYLLLASSLDEESSTLPVSASMVRFLDWLTGQWAARAGEGVGRVAGQPLPAPFGADRVRTPGGEEVPIDGTRMYRATREAGFYTFFAGDSAVAVEAVNPPESESLLAREGKGSQPVMESLVGSDLTLVSGEERWEGAIFRTRQGPEIWWPLVVATVVLLILESGIASTGRARRTDDGAFPARESHAAS
jgi:hypothetical protein